MSEPNACTFNRDQRCLKGAGCAAHGIECMRRTAALSFTMDRKQDADDAARDGTNPSADLHLHLSSERRRGLEEAAKICEAVAAKEEENIMRYPDNIRGTGEAIAAKYTAINLAKAIRALISPSSEGGEEKTDPIREEMARALEPFAAAAEELDEDSAPDLLADDDMSIETALWEASQPTVGDLRRARAALSKHRDHGDQ